MTTLDLVKKDKVMSAIVMKSEEAGFDVIEASSYKVVVKAGCLPVSITWEMCSCHGGRMWLSQSNTNIHVELSSPEYDTENGIVDPETELAFYIDNKMIDTIKSFEKYVYVVDIIGEYKDGEVKHIILRVSKTLLTLYSMRKTTTLIASTERCYISIQIQICKSV